LICAIAIGCAACSSEVAGPNRAPVAEAGPDRIAQVGDTVILDGSQSHDPDGDPLSGTWRLLVMPDGAEAALAFLGADFLSAQIVPDRAGVWIAGLQVRDPGGLSARDAVLLQVVAPESCLRDSDCEDLDYCNGLDTCGPDGTCRHSGNPCPASTICDSPQKRCVECLRDEHCPAPSEACLVQKCDVAAGACRTTNNDGAACDDGVFCNGKDTCRDGACSVHTEPPDCPFGCNPSADRCNECQDSGTCDDGNACTQDRCENQSCLHSCPDSRCVQVQAQPGSQPGQADFEIDTCPGAVAAGSVLCQSSRNLSVALLDEDLDEGFGNLGSVNGEVTLESSAQNPRRPGQKGARICMNMSSVAVSLDTSGLSEILVAFSAANESLGTDQMFVLDYTTNGSDWVSLFMFGEGKPQAYRDFFVFLPADAENQPDVDLSFFLLGNNLGINDCARLDDVRIYSLLPAARTRHLLEADFEGSPCTLGAFSVAGNAGDVTPMLDEGSCRVRLKENRNGTLLSPLIDTSAVPRENLLRLSWDWKAVGDVRENRYWLVEFSIDNGGTWLPLAATGHDEPPVAYSRFSVLLPCEAYGTQSLRIRFIAPDTTSSGPAEQIYIDNVRLSEIEPQWVDVFDPITDLGGGMLGGRIRSNQGGTAQVECRIGCGPGLQWTSREDISISP
jgi:hypothetical protein